MFERSQLGSPSPILHYTLLTPSTDIRQIGSLCCDNAEEAKSLIPSLQNKISDVDLQELLDELTKLRNFVE